MPADNRQTAIHGDVVDELFHRDHRCWRSFARPPESANRLFANDWLQTARQEHGVACQCCHDQCCVVCAPGVAVSKCRGNGRGAPRLKRVSTDRGTRGMRSLGERQRNNVHKVTHNHSAVRANANSFLALARRNLISVSEPSRRQVQCSSTCCAVPDGTLVGSWQNDKYQTIFAMIVPTIIYEVHRIGVLRFSRLSVCRKQTSTDEALN
jgi:hypothetical protein